MRFNMSNITNKLAASVKTVDGIQARLEDPKLDLVSKWFEAGKLGPAIREALLNNLAQTIVAYYEKHEFEYEANDVEGRTFSRFVVPFFENFPTTGEAKAFKKLDDAQKRRFAQSWSEVIVVPYRTGVTPTAKRTANKKKAAETQKSKPVTYDQVMASVSAFSAKEKLELLKALNKSLGLSIPANMLKVG